MEFSVVPVKTIFLKEPLSGTSLSVVGVTQVHRSNKKVAFGLISNMFYEILVSFELGSLGRELH